MANGGPPRVRWTDERVDDLANQVRALDKVPERMARMEIRLEDVGADTHNCVGSLSDLKTQLAARETSQAKERKTDRRWLLGTGLTSAGLVLAALSLLGDKL